MEFRNHMLERLMATDGLDIQTWVNTYAELYILNNMANRRLQNWHRVKWPKEIKAALEYATERLKLCIQWQQDQVQHVA